jgi:transcriptional regulator with XRE-family HTH domain
MSANRRALNANARRELAAFLQACRRRLSPQQVGLPSGERRRVKGLRREEVAALAGIGVTWYTWLEQGRDIQVSETTLNSLAQALCLSEAERTYLFLLASPDSSRHFVPIKPPTLDEDPASVQHLLDALNPYPALLRDHHWDVLAWNQAEAALTPWASIAPPERNLLLYLFTHPCARQHMPQWQEYARSVLQVFRLTWSQFLPDERLISIIDHLQQASSEFREWWQQHTVQQYPPLDLLWQYNNGQCTSFSITYLTFPMHPLWFTRVLFPLRES